jgi:hypothetical protein
MKTPKLLPAIIFAIATIGVAHAQKQVKSLSTQTSKAKANALSYDKAHHEILTGYKLMGWSTLMTDTEFETSSILFKKVNDPLIDDKIDSVFMLEQLPASVPKLPLVYSIMHTFKVNVPDSGVLRRDYLYYFDPNFKIISVDKSPADQKLKMLRQKAESARIVQRLIIEIRDYKLARLREN